MKSFVSLRQPLGRWITLPLSLPGPAARCLTGALAVATLLTGCLREAPVDPEVQPLEIIVGEDGSCGLNLDEVGAGTHDVTPIIEAGEATVRHSQPVRPGGLHEDREGR